MSGTVLNSLQGVHYVLPVLDNDVLKVEAAGRCIRVGIKNDKGIESSWFEPSYPFTPQLFQFPPQAGWKVTISIDGSAVQKFVLEKEGRRHVLTLTVTDTSVKPYPVAVTWT